MKTCMLTLANDYQIETSSNWELLNITDSFNFQIHNENTIECNNTVYKYNIHEDKSFLLSVAFINPIMKCMNNFSISSNNRFIEIYIIKEQSYGYLTTLRGTTNVDNKDLFDFEYKEKIQIKGIQLKFLSIKPLASLIFDSIDYTNTSELFLKLCNFKIEFTTVAINNLELKQTIDTQSINNIGMSMMLQMMGGSNVFSNNSIMKETLIPNIVDSKSIDKINYHNINSNSNHKGSIDQDNLKDISVVESDKIIDSNIETKTIPTKPSIKSKTTTSKQANIDCSQLSSIMWTVKNTIVNEISDLLDQKLVPIINRLDTIESKIHILSQQYENFQHNTTTKNKNDSHEIGNNADNAITANNNTTNS